MLPAVFIKLMVPSLLYSVPFTRTSGARISSVYRLADVPSGAYIIRASFSPRVEAPKGTKVFFTVSVGNCWLAPPPRVSMLSTVKLVVLLVVFSAPMSAFLVR